MWKNEITFLLLSIFQFVVATHDAVCGETNLTTAAATRIKWTAPIAQMNAPAVCKYVINGDSGKLVALTLTKVGLLAPVKGSEDPYVKIDGFMDDVQTEIASISGIKQQTTYYSTGSRMTVTINATSTVEIGAVEGSFTSDETYCGKQNLIAKSGEAITWSALAETFTEGKVCVYRIKAQPGEMVEFKLKPSGTNVEAKQKNCDKPSIKLESFVDGKQIPIVELCQGEKPDDVYTSTKEEMIVTVRGISKAKQALFEAEYKSITDPDCGPLKLKATSTPSDKWSIPLRELSSEKLCTYLIEGDASQIVELNITSFDRQTTAKTSKCVVPYLKLENVVDEEKTLIEDICDNKYPKIISSSSSKMAVSFYGKQKVKANAVNMIYKSVSLEDVCGTLSLTAKENPSDELKAPAKDLTSATTCAYTIKSSDERPVEITFQSIDVGKEEGECNKPYVKIQEVGSDSQAKDIATICGKKTNVVYTSTTSKMIVILEGVKDLKKESFTATYKTSLAMRNHFGLIVLLLTILSVFF